MTISMSLPGGRVVACPIFSVSHAASVIRAFARQRGVSCFAVEWSVFQAKREV